MLCVEYLKQKINKIHKIQIKNSVFFSRRGFPLQEQTEVLLETNQIFFPAVIFLNCLQTFIKSIYLIYFRLNIYDDSVGGMQGWYMGDRCWSVLNSEWTTLLRTSVENYIKSNVLISER